MGRKLRGGGAARADKLTELGRAVLDASEVEATKNTACGSLAKFLFEWDTSIQDTLAYTSTAVADAYQLGKGFAEISLDAGPEEH